MFSCQPGLIEEREQAADALVDGLHAAEVIVQVALVFPADEVFALELGGPKCGVSGLVIGVPGAALFRGQDRGRRELQIDRGHRAGDRHVLVVLGLAAAGIVVEESRRARDSGGRRRAPGGAGRAATRDGAPCAGT